MVLVGQLESWGQSRDWLAGSQYAVTGLTASLVGNFSLGVTACTTVSSSVPEIHQHGVGALSNQPTTTTTTWARGSCNQSEAGFVCKFGCFFFLKTSIGTYTSVTAPLSGWLSSGDRQPHFHGLHTPRCFTAHPERFSGTDPLVCAIRPPFLRALYQDTFGSHIRLPRRTPTTLSMLSIGRLDVDTELIFLLLHP